MNEEEELIIYKILLLGDICVGKTSILLKYVQDKFSEVAISTIGVDFMDKIINNGNKKIKLQIWDTSGQEKYKSIAANFLRNADGVFLVFDLTQKSSFEHVKKWLNDVNDYNEEVKIILLGNKNDLEKREVNNDTADKYANNHNFQYFETSAKNGTNINEAFKAMVNLLYGEETRERTNSARSRGNSVLSKNNTSKKKKTCCK